MHDIHDPAGSDAAPTPMGGGATRPIRPTPVYVIGHRNPDTDAVCSAIGYAEFLRRTRDPDAVAACCGGLNDRVAWVLNQAGVAPPKLVMDVRATAAGICRKDVALARQDETFLDVYQRMVRGGFRSLPVVDGEGRVVGMPTVMELLQLLLPVGDVSREARHVRASLRNVARVLGATIEHAPGADEESDLVLVVGASTVDTIRDRMQNLPTDQIVVIVGDRPRVHRVAIEAGVKCLVLTGGFGISDDVAAKARKKGVTIIKCAQDTASAVQLVRCARRVAGILHANEFKSFGAHSLVSRIMHEVADSAQPLFPVIDEDTGRLVGVFSKSDLVEPPRPRLVLVDHNEFSQAVSGADEADILEVIDHHRLSGNLVSREPIRFVNEPVGSTSTIVGRFFREAGLTPDFGTATCLAAGIISDTLKLTSPTTTALDREILPWLAENAGIDIDRFTADFFSAGSMLRSHSPEDAIRADRKEFSEGEWRISISQIEELGLDQFWELEDELESALQDLCESEGLDFACLMVTDIGKRDSVLITAGAQDAIDAIEYPELRRNLYRMTGVVSRKKQLFPYLARILGGLVKEA